MSDRGRRRVARSAGLGAHAIALIIVASLAFAAAPALASSQHLGDRVLRQGMQGHDVRALQDLLTRAGFRTPVIGVFGPITESNVRRFEAKYHLPLTVIVDAGFVRKLRAVVAALALASSGNRPSGGASTDPPSTKPKATSRPSTPSAGPGQLSSRTLKQGMSGSDVSELQNDLTLVGYPTTVDGQFGPATKASVEAFQRAHSLTADGAVTPQVAAALKAAVAAATSTAPVTRARLNPDGTVTAPSDAPASIKEVIAAANRIAFKPYIYGGGHATWNDSGYDCSGSVSYALHGAGLISAPEDSTELESYGSSGPGRWITIWANSGHTYMQIAGIWFDTGAQRSSNNNDRWSTVRANPASGYVVRHPSGL